MKGDCRTYREEIADVAEGRASQEAVDHVTGCPSCEERVALYRSVFGAAKLRRESAPLPLIDSVASLMPDIRKTIFARRLSPLVAGAVRRQSAEFQILVGDDETKLRLMVRPQAEGWIVMGRFPEGDWRLENRECEVDEDRFSFSVESLENSAFVIEGADRRLEIPSLAGLVRDDGEGG